MCFKQEKLFTKLFFIHAKIKENRKELINMYNEQIQFLSYNFSLFLIFKEMLNVGFILSVIMRGSYGSSYMFFF